MREHGTVAHGTVAPVPGTPERAVAQKDPAPVSVRKVSDSGGSAWESEQQVSRARCAAL